MKTFDIEVMNSIVNSVDVSANAIYEVTTIRGFKEAIAQEAKFQMYNQLSNVAEYLQLTDRAIAFLVERLYSDNEDLFVEKAVQSFEEAYA